MRHFRYDKLVRDNIMDEMISHGEKPNYYVLSDDEYTRELILKVAEEAQELMVASGDNVAEELTDIFEVLQTLQQHLGVSQEQLDKNVAAKQAKLGGFEKRIYIQDVYVQDTNPWLPTLESRPDKYPEITD